MRGCSGSGRAQKQKGQGRDCRGGTARETPARSEAPRTRLRCHGLPVAPGLRGVRLERRSTANEDTHGPTTENGTRATVD